MIYLEAGHESFDGIMAELHHKLLDATPVDTGHWQSLTNVPHTATRELQRVCIEVTIPETMGEAQWCIEPNLPWAEDHFKERVSGVPSNPGEEYKNWPWYRGGVEDHKGDGTFSHTYQERMWPKFANVGNTRPNGRQVFVPHNGVRYEFGDLQDLVNLLYSQPHTRQAYLPIWFPEDTGAHHGGRVPCSLGYHFMLRDGRLNVSYFMRSVDFLRYYRDDVYMAMRLCQWIIANLDDLQGEMVKGGDTDWSQVGPGTLMMHASSLHVFEGDMPKMRREAPARP